MSEVKEETTMEEQIKTIITDEINPYLAMHAGSCEFVSYEDGSHYPSSRRLLWLPIKSDYSV